MNDILLCILIIPIIVVMINAYFESKRTMGDIKKDLKKDIDEVEKENKEEIKPPQSFKGPLSRDLECYQILFDAKIEYLDNIIDEKFTKGSISWDKYKSLIDKSRTLFKKEIESANRMWSLNILINEGEINRIYNKNVDGIEKILNAVEDLMIKFISNNDDSQEKYEIENLIDEMVHARVDNYVKDV